jgi:release factor glutamine methyltransferase
MESLLTTTIDAPRLSLRLAIAQAARRLAGGGIASARLDAEVLLRHWLGWSQAQLVSRMDAELDERAAGQFLVLVERRLRREPVAYITGTQEFWSLDFQVSPSVLIPRPETECLVETALNLLAERSNEPLRIADLGTGSGAIAISLAAELPRACVTAVDISPAALELAGSNALRHRVAERIKPIHADLFAGFEAAERFDFIVANPPYVRSGEIDELAAEVSRWEPRLALDGGSDGLEFYRRIATTAWRWLAPGGALALEIGADQGSAVRRIFESTAGYDDVAVRRDYAGRDRVITMRLAAHTH